MQIEPDAIARADEICGSRASIAEIAAISQAISLKRIADRFCEGPPVAEIINDLMHGLDDASFKHMQGMQP